MRNALLYSLMLACAQAGLAQLSGPLSGTLGPGEFHVIDTIYVNAGDSLRLLPGTTFNFDGPYPFDIRGTLLAEGTQTDSIIFTTDTLANPDRWRGLRLLDSNSSGSMLAYCLVENGHATGDSPDDCGGGIRCVQSSPTFSNCRISHNLAYRHGAGVHCEGTSCSPSFLVCTFSGNRKHGGAYHAGGGGVHCYGSSPGFVDCVISGNKTNYGGGVSCSSCYTTSPSFTNCTISENSSVLHGGGVLCGNSSPTFTNCTISNNRATYYDSNGGGVYCSGQSSPSFLNCTLIGNWAHGLGGGVERVYHASPIFTNCAIIENSALGGGGVHCSDGGDAPTFTNCTISRNEGIQGGGISCYFLSSPNFINCTISGNSTRYYGAAVLCDGACSPSFLNCTISGNSVSDYGAGVYCHFAWPVFNSTVIAFTDGEGIYFDSSSASLIEYCTIFGNSGGDITFCGDDSTVGPRDIGQLVATNANGDSCDIYMNILLDPMFVDTAAGDYHLLAGSPCIDAGDPDLPLDPDSTIADIGAYYYDQRSRPPSAFNLISPDWGDTCWTLDTVLVWEPALDPDTNDIVTYEVWLDTLLNLSTAWEIASGLSDTVFAVAALVGNSTYYWTVHASDLNTYGTWASNVLMFHTHSPSPDSDQDILIPTEYSLHQNWPNPFNPTTVIRYDVREDGLVRLTIINLLGRKVTTLADRWHLAGFHTVSWNATDSPSGIYFCRMEAPGFVQTRKLVLVK